MKKRILIIGNNIYSMVRFRGGLIRQMIAVGHEVHLLIPDEDSVVGEHKALLDLLHNMGAKVHVYPLKRASVSPLHDLLSIAYLLKTIRRVGPEVVMAYMMKPVIYGLLSAWVMRVKMRVALLDGLGFAFTDRGAVSVSKSASITRLLLKTSLSKVHHVLFLNDDDGATLRSLGVLRNKTPTTIVNGTGLDLTYFDGPSASPHSRDILMISRLLRDKGVREFAAAAKLVVEQRPDARFILVGDVDNAPGAISIEEVKSWTWLNYIGPSTDVRPHLQDCLVFVLPSYREGRPRTVMEAMAMRRACVVSDVPGCRDCITPGITGLVVPPRDPRALADGILVYLSNPTLAIQHGLEARRVAEELYPEAVVNLSVLNALDLSMG
jgi:glycosyltransferase involved in cell wall biosynthesis